MKRREFVQHSSLCLLGLTFLPRFNYLVDPKEIVYLSNRPALEKRTFLSERIEQVIAEMKTKISDPQLYWMFQNCFPNTLDTTIDYEIIDGQPDTFVITGDIDAMWLRDSTAQVWPYLPYIHEDENLRQMILGLINRQVKCVLLDPYANAFYKDLTKISDWISDSPSPQPGVHERKWEIDSLCYVIRLSHEYYQITKDTSFFTEDWKKAMKLIYQTFRTEQRKDGTTPYRFARKTNQMIDAPVFDGTGRPTSYTGLIHSMFRPSDDATLYPFLIPSNLMAAQSLGQLALMFSKLESDSNFTNDCQKFQEEIKSSIEKFAVQEHEEFGKIYAYEVDGFGNRSFMDDANVPSLMSLSYLGVHQSNDKIYKRTRGFLLSSSNPYFLKGSYAYGQASPHTGKEKIWPMGIILRAMTSVSDTEIESCLKMLLTTHADTGFMHEAFHKDNPKNYNRSWFAWANTLFGELVLKLYKERPHLLLKSYA